MVEVIDLKEFFRKTLVEHWAYFVIGILLVLLYFYFMKTLSLKDAYNVLVEQCNAMRLDCYCLSK